LNDKNKLPEMKTRSVFLPVAVLVLTVVTFCEKPEPNVVQPETQGKTINNLPDEDTSITVIVYPVLPLDSVTGNDLPLHLNPDLVYGSIADIEGNIYRIIQIGNQIWMAENLRTTTFNDGSKISGFSWPDYKISYKETYGAFYDHYTVNTGKLCPTGWHVPTDEEWKEMEMALGMSRASADTSYGDFDVYGSGERGTDQGARLKSSTGWFPWEGLLVKGNNSSGFSALPAGDNDGGTIGCCTTFWCSGEEWGRTLSSTDSKIGRAVYYAEYKLSVRCVKD